MKEITQPTLPLVDRLKQVSGVDFDVFGFVEVKLKKARERHVILLSLKALTPTYIPAINFKEKQLLESLANEEIIREGKGNQTKLKGGKVHIGHVTFVEKGELYDIVFSPSESHAKEISSRLEEGQGLGKDPEAYIFTHSQYMGLYTQIAT